MAADEYYKRIINWLWNDEIPSDLDKGQKDKFLTTVKNYERDNDILFYWMNGLKLKVLFSKDDRENAILMAHINDKGRHLNKDQTLYRMHSELKFHWKDANDDINTYVNNSCSVCLKIAPIIEENIIADDKGPKILVIEIIGPVELSKRGNRFIGIVIEVDSRWINAKPMTDYAASSLAPLIHESIEQFNPYKIYFIGMASEFIKTLNEELQSETRVIHSNNNNGEVIAHDTLTREPNNAKNIENTVGVSFENVMNRYIPALHKHVCLHPKNWDRSLQAVTCDLRNHVWEDCGYSAFYAVYLQKPQSGLKMGDFNFSLSDDDCNEDSDCSLLPSNKL